MFPAGQSVDELQARSFHDCESRLAFGSIAKISCELRGDCGCDITALFNLIFEALAAIAHSSLRDASARCDQDDKITLNDGLGLVKIRDPGKIFNLLAFGGDRDFHRSYAKLCRRAKNGELISKTYQPPPHGQSAG